MEQIKLVKEDCFQRVERHGKELAEAMEANKENAAKRKISDYFGSMAGQFGDSKNVVQLVRNERATWG